MEEILALHCRNYAAYLPNLVMELDSVFVVFGICGRLYTYCLIELLPVFISLATFPGSLFGSGYKRAQEQVSCLIPLKCVCTVDLNIVPPPPPSVYEIRLGTVDQTDVDVEWRLRPYMNTARKRFTLSTDHT